MILEKNGIYAAELNLSGIPFGKSIAKSKLSSAGFAVDRIWDASDGKTYGQGRWTGETQDVEMPSQVVRAWRVP